MGAHPVEAVHRDPHVEFRFAQQLPVHFAFDMDHRRRVVVLFAGPSFRGFRTFGLRDLDGQHGGNIPVDRFRKRIDPEKDSQNTQQTDSDRMGGFHDTTSVSFVFSQKKHYGLNAPRQRLVSLFA
ncbi:hypothetical protein QWJ34_16020 [Saccharibacillus sp. CPCC 101409]|uniref:hypothetical protein n=1 Tax=Saccharibacillus sp. CPCC 101409 TaxID=3058041 RepID=UPI002673BB7B|nr:hypothetical protein [Saccharibacillus sp. CPCC 101409]MDO3411273.1 hypothetical protein [Saccharibacillus sp. CPCC 101409]